MVKLKYIAIFLFAIFSVTAYPQSGATSPHLTKEQKKEMKKKKREFKKDHRKEHRQMKKDKGRRKKGKHLKNRIDRSFKKEIKLNKRIIKVTQKSDPYSPSPKLDKLKGKLGAVRRKRSKLSLKLSHKIQDAEVEKRMKSNVYKEKPKKRKKYNTD